MDFLCAQARYGRMFSMDADSGNITTSDTVDFAASTQIKLVVLATDRGENAIPTSTTVTLRPAEVNHHAPSVLVQSLDGEFDTGRLKVAENSPAGTFVALVLVTDPDFGSAGQVECRLENDDDDARDFHLVPVFSDAVAGLDGGTEYQLVSGGVFDREDRPAFEISLFCADFGDPARTVRRPLVVEVADVDDNRPVFGSTLYNFTVAENNRRGQVVGRISASDADDGPNSDVKYHLDPDSDSDTWFSVDPSSGVITAKVSFDREFVDHFRFVVYATSGSTSSQVWSFQWQIQRGRWGRPPMGS